jgi:hypothetical protein
MIWISRKTVLDAELLDRERAADAELAGFVGSAIGYVIGSVLLLVAMSVGAPIVVAKVIRIHGASLLAALAMAVAGYVVALWGLTNGFLWQTALAGAVASLCALVAGTLAARSKTVSRTQERTGPRWHFS